MNMNARLLGYLRSLGLAENSTDEQAWDFFNGLRGLQSSIANSLNYNENDQQARTNCDLMIRALGYDPADPAKLLEEVPANTQRQTAPATGSDGASTAGDLETARQEGATLERQRVAAIRQYAQVAGSSADFVAGLIDDPAISEETARTRIFEDHTSRTRATVPSDIPGAPAAHIRGGVTEEILEAAMLHQRGLDPTTQWARNDQNTPTLRRPGTHLERAADLGYQYRRCSLEDIIRMCASLDGVTLPSGRDGILQAYTRAAVSTSALTNVFTTNVHSELLAAFQVAPDSTTGGWIREAEVANFQTNERARMLQGGALAKLPRGGTADHADYEDIVESYKIARYARQFVIDDQDIQDDHFGGITGFVPADMGVAARQLRPDLVYSILMANAAMRDAVALFHADHANLNTSSALATAGVLGTSRKAMRIQQEGVRNLNISAKFIIIPPALEDAAEILIDSRNYITGATTVLAGEKNPNFGKGLVAVPEARLENGVVDPTDATGLTTHAGSATTWFLAAVASNHTIEVGYLRGAGRVPQIRPFILDQGQWGLGWDVKMDIGAKALDWLGMSKNTA